LGLYVIGDRMPLEVAASEHVNFLKNQMTWRIVERVEGQPWVEPEGRISFSPTSSRRRQTARPRLTERDASR